MEISGRAIHSKGLYSLNDSPIEMCGAACEAVAIHLDLAATKQIHLPARGEKGR
jgi:hypothetical protein